MQPRDKATQEEEAQGQQRSDKGIDEGIDVVVGKGIDVVVIVVGTKDKDKDKEERCTNERCKC